MSDHEPNQKPPELKQAKSRRELFAWGVNRLRDNKDQPFQPDRPKNEPKDSTPPTPFSRRRLFAFAGAGVILSNIGIFAATTG